MTNKRGNYRHTEESKQKIRDARRRRKELLGCINLPETRKKIAKAQQGRCLSDDTKAKMSGAKKGRKPKNFEEFLKKAHATPKRKGADHRDWKGDAVGYSGLHAWVRRELGTPSRCENCGTTEAKQFEWANKSGEYKRDLTDWIRLCTLCHRRMDRAKVHRRRMGAVEQGQEDPDQHRADAFQKRSAVQSAARVQERTRAAQQAS